jgi:hypothetical protein
LLRCEETLINLIEADNVLDLLVLMHQSQLEESELEMKLKKAFFAHFRRIKQRNGNLEEVIHNQKGLMVKLFDHISGKSKSLVRKVTFVDD